jgi:cyanophycinase-like exopeptidase
MGDAPKCRVLAIMGSGETSPTMVTVHKALAARLGAGSHSAVLLDTPYAFQENAADISARSQAYFARSVGLQVAVVTDADLRLQQSPAATAGLAAIRTSDWVFIGPGSPSYALNRWRGGPVARALRDRIAGGVGVTVIASAAAAAMGVVAVPVYEIYKVGAEPHWLDGLDLLSVLGLKVTVIPHYDNAEGGTHDTRFCYLGERRLSMLERDLPADAAVLGVDEHTALIFDLVAQVAEVVGRGAGTVRRAGISTVLPSGSRITLPDLRTLASTGTLCVGIGGPGQAAEPRPESDQAAEQPPAGAISEDLPDVTAEVQRRFETAIGAREATAMVTAILDLEAAIEAWATDTDQNDNSDRARAVLRGLIGRLGRAADQGLADPADRLRPAIGPLVTLRETLRCDGSYAAADEIRSALTAAGIDLRDSPDGTRWTVRAAGPAADGPAADGLAADGPAADDAAADGPAGDDATPPVTQELRT